MARSKGAVPRLMQFSYACDPLLKEKLDRRAKDLGRSVSWVIRTSVAKYLGERIDASARRPLSLDLAPRRGSK